MRSRTLLVSPWIIHHNQNSERITSEELEALPDFVNDLDVDFTENPAASHSYQQDTRNIRKVKEATENLKVNIIYPLRPGKKLLVLDIDYSAWRFHFDCH
jgi:ubiquitin-like domain-containing CTD phosphatase 1